MIWSVFLGVAVAFRHGAMISVDIIMNALPRRLGLALFVGANAASLVFFAILAWQGWLMTGRVMNQKLAALEVSIAWVYAALPVGSVFIMIAVIAATIRGLRRGRVAEVAP
jgi:TRAP-type C4-dicarboxylate transport system permease small subunit